jgi:hypothetical protein
MIFIIIEIETTYELYKKIHVEAARQGYYFITLFSFFSRNHVLKLLLRTRSMPMTILTDSF